MRWNPKKRRCTIQELALYFHTTDKQMERAIKKAGVDLNNIGSIIHFGVCQANFEIGRQMEVREEQTN